ncbi:MAG: hypothetical protein CL916_04775 [Deltaproteobacteria bacterium]|nr:hypothetical protein [Deltaproteobacteria bacterium]
MLLLLMLTQGCLERLVFEKEYAGACPRPNDDCLDYIPPPIIEVEPPCADIAADKVLNIMTWNIEWFPKNEQDTIDYVKTIIQQVDVDVLAIQEVYEREMFDEMLASLPEYAGYYESAWFAGLAYIYKKSTIDVHDIFEIYTTSSYWNAFPRSPMVMDMSAYGERYILINNHLKCCGDGIIEIQDSDDEEWRRVHAMNLLLEYIEGNMPNEKVIVLGDLNDNITEPASNNVFQAFLNLPNQYRFVDMEIAMGGIEEWSFPSWPSHLDHILVSKEIFPLLPSSHIYTLKIDQYLQGGLYEYDRMISDHRPVGICLDAL